MNLESLVPSLNTKQASAKGDLAPKAQGTSKVASAVAEAAQAVGNKEKVASVLPQIEKLANEVAAQDNEQAVKVAHTVGAAMADGFMSQIAMYEKIAESLHQKTASLAGTIEGVDPDVLKFAKLAMEDPRAAFAQLQKAAEEEDQQLKAAEDQEAAQLEQSIHTKCATHYADGYAIGQLMVQG